MRKIMLTFMGMLVLFLLFTSSGAAWACEDAAIPFTHVPSDYYGPGEYFAECPETGIRIRCYHYHRHWVCEKEETYYWDHNLESAARTACDCPLPPGTEPSAPAVSTKPATRFHDVPAQ